jgi:hypothetical protein
VIRPTFLRLLCPDLLLILLHCPLAVVVVVTHLIAK